MMNFYPDAPKPFRRVITRDLVVLALLVLFVWMGVKSYQAVDRLSVLGEGVEQAGTSVNDGFDAAASTVGGLPVVGDRLSDALTSAGQTTGGNVADIGRQGQQNVETLARGTGVAVVGVPTLIVLLIYLPGRIRLMRDLAASKRVFIGLDDPDRRRLIAMRAAMSLPLDQLLDHTPDPFGDLLAGRHDALVSAALEDCGLLDLVA